MVSPRQARVPSAAARAVVVLVVLAMVAAVLLLARVHLPIAADAALVAAMVALVAPVVGGVANVAAILVAEISPTGAVLLLAGALGAQPVAQTAVVSRAAVELVVSCPGARLVATSAVPILPITMLVAFHR
jgi:hypothetical protein